MNKVKTKIFGALRLLNKGYGKYKPQIAVLVALGFLAGLLEGVGVNAIIPLFSFVNRSDQTGTDAVSRFIERLFHYFNFQYSVGSIIIFIVALFIFKALVSLLVGYISVRINANYEQEKRSELFASTLAASWPHLLNQKIGHLEKILTTDIGSSTSLLRYLTSGILLVTSLIMYTLIALNISFNITLLTLLLGIVLFFGFKPLAERTQNVSKEFMGILKQAAHRVNESMIGIKTIKAAATEPAIIKESDGYFRNLATARIKTSWYNSIATSLTQPISLIFISAVFALSYKTPGFNFASFAVIIYLIQRIFTYVQAAQEKFQNINEMIPYLRSVVDYEAVTQKNKEPLRGTKDFEFKRELVFKNVRFSYETQKNLLKDLNFTVHKGEMVGLIGPSGAGKTTIVDLLLSLFVPQKGQILIDDLDVSEIDIKKWRQHLGYVSQDIFLLNDTIENNIRFYDSSITQKDLVDYAKMANLYNFIQELPEGFKTIVGERGVKLSAGQRQRIILARVLARKPDILILDEATSALDNESEKLIQEAISRLKGKITVIAIAHRLSTVMNTDQLLVLEDGAIVEQGPPQSLLKNKNSYFYKVYNIRNTAQYANA